MRLYQGEVTFTNVKDVLLIIIIIIIRGHVARSFNNFTKTSPRLYLTSLAVRSRGEVDEADRWLASLFMWHDWVVDHCLLQGEVTEEETATTGDTKTEVVIAQLEHERMLLDPPQWSQLQEQNKKDVVLRKITEDLGEHSPLF